MIYPDYLLGLSLTYQIAYFVSLVTKLWYESSVFFYNFL